MRKCYLNNRIMEAVRGDKIYQTVIIDLINCGAIDKDVGEGLLGYRVSEYLQLPANFEEFLLPNGTADGVAVDPITGLPKETVDETTTDSTVDETTVTE